MSGLVTFLPPMQELRVHKYLANTSSKMHQTKLNTIEEAAICRASGRGIEAEAL